MKFFNIKFIQEIWLTAAMQRGINDETATNLQEQEEEEKKHKMQHQDEESALNETKVLKVMARDLARREAEIERKEVFFYF